MIEATREQVLALLGMKELELTVTREVMMAAQEENAMLKQQIAALQYSYDNYECDCGEELVESDCDDVVAVNEVEFFGGGSAR
jgi:hypothetical protein